MGCEPCILPWASSNLGMPLAALQWKLNQQLCYYLYYVSKLMLLPELQELTSCDLKRPAKPLQPITRTG